MMSIAWRYCVLFCLIISSSHFFTFSTLSLLSLLSLPLSRFSVIPLSLAGSSLLSLSRVHVRLLLIRPSFSVLSRMPLSSSLRHLSPVLYVCRLSL